MEEDNLEFVQISLPHMWGKKITKWKEISSLDLNGPIFVFIFALAVVIKFPKSPFAALKLHRESFFPQISNNILLNSHSKFTFHI